MENTIIFGRGLDEYLKICVERLKSCNKPQDGLIIVLEIYIKLLGQADKQDKFGEPMPWIGMYIALASLLCILAMVADLLHGLRSKKLWFPCIYFTMNAASLSVISVAMKLPMDMNNPMPGPVDQFAKLGSMAFMCAIMSNLLPSLAAMDNKDLIANIIALGVQVITLVVNVCIQIKTGVVEVKIIAIFYVALLSMLLIIHACSSLAILKSKQLLQMKYKVAHETALKDQELQQGPPSSTVEKLKQHVKKYWIMAATGNPQFLTACFVTSCASGLISVISTILHVFLIISSHKHLFHFASDYKWSTSVILVTQFIGSLLGTIAPLSRCFASLSFKLSIKVIWNKMKVFNVERYWIQTLSDLKESSTPFLSYSCKFKILFQYMKLLIFGFCIGFQKTVVVASKIIDIVPIFVVICVFSFSCCCKFLKWMLLNAFRIVSATNRERNETNENLSRYVLQVQDDMELAERTLKRISKSFDRLLKKAEKQQPNHLMKLLDESTGSRGVENFYNIHRVPPIVLEEEPLICWSLSVVTLTSIAICLTNIQSNLVNRLMRGVNQGVVYATLVEESLNATDDHVSLQKVAKNLWVEVEVYRNWLGNKLRKPAPQVNTAGQILLWLRDTARSIWSMRWKLRMIISNTRLFVPI